VSRQVLDRIRSHGYWRVNFQPMTATRKLKSLGDCQDIVRRNALNLRGWDYPHYPLDADADTGIHLEKTYCEAWIDWLEFKELWRMYESGQFIHYVALWEDWRAEAAVTAGGDGQVSRLSVVGAIYRLTEIFEFASRLARDSEGIYANGVRINVSLRHTANRALWLEEPLGLPLMRTYRCRQEQVDLESREYLPDKLLQTSKADAFAATVYLFQNFGWSAPNTETIRSYQDRLLRHDTASA